MTTYRQVSPIYLTNSSSPSDLRLYRREIRIVSLCIAGHNMIDWSKRNYIAVVYDGDAFIWRGEKEAIISIDVLGIIKQCLKFDWSGTRLAMALDQSQFLIMNIETNKVRLIELNCAYSKDSTFRLLYNVALVIFSRITSFNFEQICFKDTCCKGRNCCVTSFAWSKKGRLLSGCTTGRLTSWNLSGRVEKLRRRAAHNGSVIALRFSCNENYLASSGLDNNLMIWNWPGLEPKCRIVCFLPVKVSHLLFYSLSLFLKWISTRRRVIADCNK